MTASTNVDLLTLPSLSIRMSHTMQRRSTFGLSEHKPLDNTSGNIGTTRSGKYTDVPRVVACLSRAVPTST